jgi:SAM-dependent methyltransferase
LEVGCGTGAISRVIASWPGVAEVVGVDPSPLLLAKAEAFQPAYITAPWIMGVSHLVASCGFASEQLRSHGYVQVTDPEYMLSIADRGAESLAAAVTIGTDLADARKTEARRRVAANTFFGHVAHVSITARKPLA